MTPLDPFLPQPQWTQTLMQPTEAPAAQAAMGIAQFDVGDRGVRTVLGLRQRVAGLLHAPVDFGRPLVRLGRLDDAAMARDATGVVLGFIGKFWQPAADIRLVDGKTFKIFNTQGYAKVAWSLRAAANSRGSTLLFELRALGLGRGVAAFAAYWAAVWLPSRLIRGLLLRAIAADVEQNWQRHRG